MSILQLDPFQEIERWLDQQSVWRLPSPVPMDAYRRDGYFEIDFDVPGVDPNAIELTVEHNVLSVKTERRDTDPDAEIIASERPRGTFIRQVVLGENLDTNRLEASCHDGVLHVVIPIAEHAQARRIEIGSSSQKAIGSGTTA